MRFVKRLELAKDFFAPRYFAINTKSFRRLSSDKITIEDIDYNLWWFVSPKIPIGAALLPASGADHMIIFSLEKTESINNVPFKFKRYLEANETTIDKLVPGQGLYVTLEEIDKRYREQHK